MPFSGSWGSVFRNHLQDQGTHLYPLQRGSPQGGLFMPGSQSLVPLPQRSLLSSKAHYRSIEGSFATLSTVNFCLCPGLLSPLPYVCQNNMCSPISLLHINLHLRFCFQRTQPRTHGEEVEETDRKGKKAKEGCINERVMGVGSWTQIFLGIL